MPPCAGVSMVPNGFTEAVLLIDDVLCAEVDRPSLCVDRVGVQPEGTVASNGRPLVRSGSMLVSTMKPQPVR